MHLQVGQNIDGKRVRLDFRKSPVCPDNAPSYTIEKSKADEFVKKYNRQANNLLNISVLLSSAFAILGGIFGLKSRSWKNVTASIFGGTLIGLASSIIFSSYKKNKLMNKYDVKKL